MSIIVLEGLDGSGKGTVCQLLATAKDAVIYKTPPEHMREEQDRVNATANDLDHYHYFIRVVQEASRELPVLASRGNVIVDRYWPTTVAYHRAMGVNAKIEDFGEIVLPDYIVYLTVSDEAQAERIAGRGGMSPGDKRMHGRQSVMRAEYDLALAGLKNVVTVNTTGIPPTEVCRLALEGIEALGG